jgi:hypothetical protein
VQDEVAKELADEAARAKKTLYGFSNECMQIVLKILHEHGSLEEIYPYWLQSKMSKETDGMPFLNRGLLDSLVKTFYSDNTETVLKIFFETGILFGSYVKLRAKNLDDLWGIINLFKLSIPARVFEMDRIENDESDRIYIMRYVSGISDELTMCMAKYFDGLFSCYSSNRRSTTSSSGAIEIEVTSSPG